MDDDIANDLEVQKARIEEEIRKRRRANAKARKQEEERVLIAAAEGKSALILYKMASKTLPCLLQGRERRRKRQ